MPDLALNPPAITVHDPSFSQAVIHWQKQHGRHNLPWQHTCDAYRVWLSEIMLQQTQVATVIPYYQHFLRAFPTVDALANAPAEQVMACWSGLGYYSRARNLHRCAQIVVTEYGGTFPDDPALLQTLPGIGRSTAAAIAVFSYGIRAAILDGNVKRVFARVLGVDKFPGEKAVENDLWQHAQALLPKGDIKTYTQGLMDLGATLCTRNRPACVRCPLVSRCVAHLTGRVALLPVKKPKKASPQRYVHMLVVTHDHFVLLVQRPASGIWGGLLSLPEQAPSPNNDAITAQHALTATAAHHGTLASFSRLPGFTHVFTHFRLHVTPWHAHLQTRHHEVAQTFTTLPVVWYPVNDLAGAPLPAPVKKMLLALFATRA